MDVGLNGLTGRNAREPVEQETRRERGPVPTHHRLTMVETVGERMLEVKTVIVTHVKVSEYK